MEASKPSRSKGKIALLIGGIVLALIALAVAAGGGTAIWADATQRDSHGYVSTSKHDFRSSARAITTDKIDIGTDIPEWLFGKIRIETTTNDSSRPIFVGIARKSDVDAYLAGVDRAVVKDLDFDPFNVSYERQAGTRIPASPASQRFWAASLQGAGTNSLTWPLKSGQWSVVLMNADGSPGVDADVSAGAKVPYALWFGIGLSIAGLLLLGGAVLMIVAGLRRQGPPAPPAQAIPSV